MMHNIPEWPTQEVQCHGFDREHTYFHVHGTYNVVVFPLAGDCTLIATGYRSRIARIASCFYACEAHLKLLSSRCKLSEHE